MIFPDQTGEIAGGAPIDFAILATSVWAARNMRITNARTKDVSHILAEFPFHAGLDVVGCINYQSSGSPVLYQTSFGFGISRKPNGEGFPLLSGQPLAPSADKTIPGSLSDFRIVVRELQRAVQGDEIRLGEPMYGTFAK